MDSALLHQTFLVVDAGLGVHPVPVGPTLYEDLDARFSGFQGCLLVAEYAFDQDWSTWERHPAGDEILYLLEGAAELLLRMPDGIRSRSFDQPGEALVIPRGTWHTARVKGGRARILFITPGEGTANAADPGSEA
ncbi:MAG TPA: cupin domain-containing protein [Holophagaceae bacterium]